MFPQEKSQSKEDVVSLQDFVNELEKALRVSFAG